MTSIYRRHWLSFIGLILAAQHAPSSLATRISLDVDVLEKSVGIVVLAEDRELCAGKKESSTCEFDLPKASQWRVSTSPLPAGGSMVRILDIGPAMRKLDPSADPYGERFARFMQATAALVHQQVHGLDHPLMESGKPATQAEVDAAIRRLGFALPADFVSLQRRLGTVTMQDHNLMAIEDVDNAYAQMRKVWGTPEEGMQADYSPTFREVLKHSTLLFTEVGDGLGGLLYRPGDTKACGAGGTYYWTSQEGGTEVLKHPNGRCMDFAESMRWVVNGFVVDALAETVSESNEPSVLVDSSMSTQRMVLHFDGAKPVLRSAWPGPHL